MPLGPKSSSHARFLHRRGFGSQTDRLNQAGEEVLNSTTGQLEGKRMERSLEVAELENAMKELLESV